MMTNIQQMLKNKCPNIVTIIGEKAKFWSQVELTYLQRIEFIKGEIKDKNYITIRKSLIDDIILFKSERIKLTAFLFDIDLKVKTIYDNFYNNKRNVDKLRSILQQLVLPEKENPKSYDRIAEIYAIEYLLTRKHLKIVELEHGLSNGKHADCLIQVDENGEYLLLDFFSINVDTCRVESPEKFGKYLVDRIIKKYKSKTCNLQTLDYPFRLLPILWLEDKILKDNFDMLVDSETNLNTEFFTLRGIENITERKYHTLFGPISDFKYLA